MESIIIRKLEHIISDINSAEKDLLSNPTSPDLAKKYSHLTRLATLHRGYLGLIEQIKDTESLLRSEIGDFAQKELDILLPQKNKILRTIKELLIPIDSVTRVFLEIRAGTGGEDACIFAGQLFNMYEKFSKSKGWTIRIIDSHIQNLRIKRITITVSGKGVHSLLKHEAGVHQIQRVPITESGGRVHTSTATVSVLPELENIDLDLKDSDLDWKICKSSGPGGQSVNTTDSAVTVIHKPTGVSATSRMKSQKQNKDEALRNLKAKMVHAQAKTAHQERNGERKSQIGTGMWAEKIRTYSAQHNHVRDHRLENDPHSFDDIFGGDLDDLITRLRIQTSR